MPNETSPADDSKYAICGIRVALLGSFAGMSKRNATKLLRSQGAIVSEKPGPHVSLLVVGQRDLLYGSDEDLEDRLDEPTREALDRGDIELIVESKLWQRLGMVADDEQQERLYTPAMLAEMLGIPVATIRRWHRQGLIQPLREVHKLPYFDFEDVTTARRLAELISSGVSPAAIEAKLGLLRRWLPEVERPLAQLSILVEGSRILLRHGDGWMEPSGQLHFDFDAIEPTPSAVEAEETVLDGPFQKVFDPESVEGMVFSAARFEEEGRLDLAIEMLRAAMAAGGATAERCFQTAELLYRSGDLNAARERYYMAIELDEDYVEARANLGCVLAELGQTDLAIAALRGALEYHQDYHDARFHLARVLQDAGRLEEAGQEWLAFLDGVSDGPWADEARQQLAMIEEAAG